MGEEKTLKEILIELNTLGIICSAPSIRMKKFLLSRNGPSRKEQGLLTIVENLSLPLSIYAIIVLVGLDRRFICDTQAVEYLEVLSKHPEVWGIEELYQSKKFIQGE